MIETPAFVIDLAAIEHNAAILDAVRQQTGCRILLALKAFSTVSAFPVLQCVLDGCCASSVHEARLAHDCFGKEVHAFATAFSEAEMREIAKLADHVTLNSLTQWQRFRQVISDMDHPPICGLRINPEHSEGATALYDPCASGSRLGIRCVTLAGTLPDGITGLHAHTLCEQDAAAFVRTLAAIETRFATLIPHLRWMNFGGGHHITRPGYDVALLCKTLNTFKQCHPQIKTLYLEPGEACVLNAGTLVTTVLDVVENNGLIAILDASCACHMPDVLEMPYRPRVFRDKTWRGEAMPKPSADRGQDPGVKRHTVRLAGATCLAGDIIGEWSFDQPLQTGDQLIFEDMAHYTMVKTNTFNGIRLPDIVLRERDGTHKLVRRFGYADFKSRL